MSRKGCLINLLIGFLILVLIGLATDDGQRGPVGASKDAPTTATREFDIREARWGMTRAQVKASEEGSEEFMPEEFSEWGANGVGYRVRAGGMPAIAFYLFVEGRLVLGIYKFTDDHNLKDWADVQRAMIDLYGEPEELTDLWSDNLYKAACWQTERTTIAHILKGNNFSVLHSLAYIQRDMEDELEEWCKSIAAKGF